MSWIQVAEEAEVDEKVLKRMSALRDEDFDFLDEILEACETIEPIFSVVEDRSPVLQGEWTYLARLDHEEGRIELNGWALDRSRDPEGLREFMILHELFHAWVLACGQTSLWDQFGLGEENMADLLALCSLRNNETSEISSPVL